MFFANLRVNLSDFLAQSLRRWADFLRQHNAPAPNFKKTDSLEPPENDSPLEDWLQKTKGQPPADWLARVSRDAPQLLVKMPEFNVQTIESSEDTNSAATALPATKETRIDHRRNISSIKQETELELSSNIKTDSTPPLKNLSDPQKPKHRLSPLKLFLPQEKSSRRLEAAKNVSAESNEETNLANKNKAQTDSSVPRNEALPPRPRQTSVIKFKRRETKFVNESNSADFNKPNSAGLKPVQVSADDSHRHLEQTNTHQPIKFRSKTVSDITQERGLQHRFEHQSDKSGESSVSKTKPKKTQPRVESFIRPTAPKRFDDEPAIMPALNKIRPTFDNFLPKQTKKLSAPDVSEIAFAPQANQWAELPQSIESSNEDELSSRERARLRRVEAEQTGGGWNV